MNAALRTCDECLLPFSLDLLVQSDVFGARLVCEHCAEALNDESTYDQHAGDDLPGLCHCTPCERHRDRVLRARNLEQLVQYQQDLRALDLDATRFDQLLGTAPSGDPEDIDF